MTDPRTYIAGEDGAPFLAVDVLPDNTPGTFQVDVSELDGPDLLGWGMDGWSNIVCTVQSVAIRRGATRLQGALTKSEAGTCAVTLSDVDRRFDPMVNADAIHPGTPVRVRAWGYRPLPNGTDELWSAVLFTGRIGADYAVTYLQEDPPVVTFTAVDVISRLSRYSALGRPDPGVGAGDTLRSRTARVLAEVGLPVDTLSTDSDASYRATLAATSLTRGWDVVSDAVDAELGRAWVNAAGQIVTRSRGSELTGAVRGTLSDVHGETVSGAVHCCYSDPVVRFGTDSLTNRALASRRVPNPGDGSTPATSALVQADDTYSQQAWDGVYAYEDRSLELQDDAQLQTWAETLVLTAATPELRVDSVTVAPRDAPDAWPAVAQTDLGDRWHFRLNPTTGPQVARTLGILGLEHVITPTSWQTTYLTTDAPAPGDANPSGWFVIGLSELGGEDVVAPFGGLVPA